MSRLLDIEDLSVTYGGVTAVDHVSLSVDDGSVVGLIGPNGAGKTSLIDALTGFTRISTGEIRFENRRIDTMRPHARARAGLVRTFQSLELFDDLTVAENLVVAAEPVQWWDPFVDVFRPHRPRVQHDTQWALDVVGVGDIAERLPVELSHGERRMVALARAIASRPRLVLLDEPAAGLDSSETELLAALIRQLPELGIAVLLVDHDMGLVLGVCSTVNVLDFGRVLASGPPAAIRENNEVIAAYLGGEPTP